MGGMRIPLTALLWIPLKAQMLSVEPFRRGNPSTLRGKMERSLWKARGKTKNSQ